MKFKHIFSDVDGTLANTSTNTPTFDPNLIERINQLNKYNLGFSIATGRHYQDVVMMLKRNKLFNVKYIIGIAGAQIYDNETKQLILDRVFDDFQVNKLKEIYSYLKSNYYNHFTLIIFSNNKNGADSMNLINDESPLFINYIGKSMTRMVTNINHLDLIVSRDFRYDNIYKLALTIYNDKFERDEKLFLKIKEELVSKWGKYLDFVVCGKAYLEICMKSISKAFAIKFILDNYLKLSVNDLIAFGDSDNDKEMFELINESVTRSSAPESIKSVSKHIIDAEPSTFVLEAIDKIYLK